MLKPFTLIEVGRHGERKYFERYLGPHLQSKYYLIRAEGKRAVPRLERKNELDWKLQNGAARIVEPDPIQGNLRELEALGPKERRRLEDEWHIVNALSKHPDILKRAGRGKLLNQVCKCDRTLEFTPESVLDLDGLLSRLPRNPEDAIAFPIEGLIWRKLSEAAKASLDDLGARSQWRNTVIAEFDRLCKTRLYEAEEFNRPDLNAIKEDILKGPPDDVTIYKLNRIFLERVFPLELAKYDSFYVVGTLYNLLRKFWQRGGTKQALQAGYSNSHIARTRKPRRLAKDLQELKQKGFKKWGARGKYRKGRGVNVTKADRENFNWVIDKHLNKNPNPPSFKQLHVLLLAQRYTDLPEEECPSINQLRYHYEKIPLDKRLKDRDGELKVNKSYRPVTGNETARVIAPGDEYQIDATVADVHLVDPLRKYSIGRPTLYLVVDTYSRMITGIHVSLEPTCFTEATEAIWNAFDDKVRFCKRFGISITEKEWPVRGLPASLFADRGEIVLRDFNQIVEDLGVRIRNAPAHRADLKGLVERCIGLVNERLALLAGAIPKDDDYDKSECRDYRKRACLTLREFTAHVIRVVLELNSICPKEPIQRPGMVTPLIDASPLRLWDWGMEHLTGGLRSGHPALVRTMLLSHGTADITGGGVIFRELQFLPRNPERHKMFLIARADGISEREIRFHSYSVGTIYLLNKTTGDVDACDLAPKFKEHAGKSWTEWEKFQDNYGGDAFHKGNFKARQQTAIQGQKAVADAQKATADKTHGRGPSTKGTSPAKDRVRQDGREGAGRQIDVDISAGLPPSKTNPSPKKEPIQESLQGTEACNSALEAFEKLYE